MKFIPEKIIDVKAAELGQAAQGLGLRDTVQHFKAAQPALLFYLFSDSFELLTQSEREYMTYLALVIWASSSEIHPDQPQIALPTIETIEDQNWEILKNASGKHFRERLDAFFENYPQEDLLAFAEDALVHDEDDMVSAEGREYVFIALKTIIDCLHNSIK